MDVDSNTTRILACEHGNRRVTVSSFQGNRFKQIYTVLAETFNGLPLNSPNDLAIHPTTSDIFFTDPPYGLNGKEKDAEWKQSFNGVFYIDGQYAEARIRSAESGIAEAVPLREPTLVSKAFTRPNGIAFSGDGRRM